MTDSVFFTAPDGPMLADVRLPGGWACLVVVAGAAIIAAGWLLLS